MNPIKIFFAGVRKYIDENKIAQAIAELLAFFYKKNDQYAFKEVEKIQSRFLNLKKLDEDDTPLASNYEYSQIKIELLEIIERLNLNSQNENGNNIPTPQESSNFLVEATKDGFRLQANSKGKNKQFYFFIVTIIVILILGGGLYLKLKDDDNKSSNNDQLISLKQRSENIISKIDSHISRLNIEIDSINGLTAININLKTKKSLLENRALYLSKKDEIQSVILPKIIQAIESKNIDKKTAEEEIEDQLNKLNL
ncbi:MAG: hypothetical protein QM737_09920 [Ferruginibacter sp.]